MLGDTEGESEQKDGSSKEKQHQEINTSFWESAQFSQEDEMAKKKDRDIEKDIR